MISLEVFEELLRASVAAGKLTEAQAIVEAERRRAWLGSQQAAALHAPHGPGTELKKLLAKIGIASSPTCSCNKRAKAMDENGIEWCEQNVETICDWLAEESAKRKLPFVRLAGKAIIHMAIRRAKKGNNK